MAVVESTISNLIKQQFPEFYHEEGPIFVAFVEKYFEWLETSQSVANQTYSEAKQNCKINVVAGNTTIRASTNTATFTNCFSNGASIAIYTKSDGSDYNIYTVNTVISDLELTLTEVPDFSITNTRFSITKTQRNPLSYLRSFYDDIDVDTTSEEFLVYFKEKYLKDIELRTDVDTRRLVKHALDIYRSKGTERGADLLFKMVYGVPAKFYYPGNDLFRLSDGQWTIPRYIEVALKDTNKLLVGKQIFGYKSGATAFAESVIRRTVSGRLIDVIYVSAINGTFETGELVNSSDFILDKFERPAIIGSFTTLEITNGGSGFEVGDLLTIDSPEGEGATARVDATVNVAGIVQFELEDGGYGYQTTSEVMISEFTFGISDLFVPDVFRPSTNSYFEMFSEVVQPLANVAYANSTGQFVDEDVVSTYHANGDLKATGIVLNSTGNSTVGTVLISVSNGSLVADFNDSRLYGVGNTVNSDISAYADITAVANTFCVLDEFRLFLTNVSNGTFVENETVIQYNPVEPYSQILATGEINLVTTGTGGNATLQMIHLTGRFRSNNQIIGLTSGATANVFDQQINFGVKDTLNTFYREPGNYVYIGYSNTVTGTINNISAGQGATFQVGLLSNTETVNLNSDWLIDHYTDPLLHGSLTGTASINTTSNTVTGTGTAFDTEVGYNLTGNVTVFTTSNTVIGNGTDFVNELTIGDIIEINDAYYARVRDIVNSTYMYVNSAPTTSGVNVPYKLARWITFTDGANIESHQVAGVTSNTSMTLATTPGFVAAAAGMTYSWGYPGNTSANLTNDTLASILSNSSVTVGRIQTIDGINPGNSYAQDPCVQVYEPLSYAHREKDGYYSISNVAGFFTEGELVTQTETGARGIVGSYDTFTSTLWLKRLRLLDSDDFIITTNPNNIIHGTSSGATANIDTLGIYSNSRFLGLNANVDANVIIGPGYVTNVQILTSGFGYVEGEAVTVTLGNNQLDGIIHLGNGVGTGNGYYRREGSFLSSDDKLFDAYYYQDFSYELRSPIPLSTYEKMLKQLIHVAGTKYYGAFVYDAFGNNVINTNTAIVTTNTLPGYYVYPGVVPKTIADFAGVKNNGEEYFQMLGVETTFDAMFDYTGLDAPATMFNANGYIVWSPHNLNYYSNDFDQWTPSFAGTGTSPTVTSGQEDPFGGNEGWRLQCDKGTSNTLTDSSYISTTCVDLTSYGNNTISVWAKSTDGVSTYDITLEYSSTGGKRTVTGDWQKLAVIKPAAGQTTADIGLRGGTLTCSNTCDILIYCYHTYRSTLGGVADNPDQTVSGLETYVPTTTAARYLPRRKSYSYDSVSNTVVAEGITLEAAAATNLLIESNDFTSGTGAWSGTGTGTLANDAEGPDGVATSATTLVDSGATGTGEVFVSEAVTVATATAYTFSVYAKADQLNWMGLVTAAFTTPADGVSYFDLANGVVGSTTTSHTLTMEDVGGGWYRCSITFTTDAADTAGSLQIRVADGDLDSSVDRDGTSSILIYGAQLEASSIPTSYIPTNGAANTRQAELLSMTGSKLATSTNAMSFQMKGTLSYTDQNTAYQQHLYGLNAYSAGGFVVATISTNGPITGSPRFRQSNGTVTDETGVSPYIDPGVNVDFNIAARYTSSAINGAAGGTLAVEDATVTDMADLSSTTLRFFVTNQNAGNTNGTIALFQQDDNDWTDTGVTYESST